MAFLYYDMIRKDQFKEMTETYLSLSVLIWDADVYVANSANGYFTCG